MFAHHQEVENIARKFRTAKTNSKESFDLLLQLNQRTEQANLEEWNAQIEDAYIGRLTDPKAMDIFEANVPECESSLT